MILVDTSVWIDHLRRSDAVLLALLNRGQVLGHPMVIGELAMGSLRNRKGILGELARLPASQVLRHDEVLAFVESHHLYALGIGFSDAHLLASAMLTPHTELWSRDRRLHDAAIKLGLAHIPA